MAKPGKSAIGDTGKIELALHASCVRAGAYAIAHGIITRFPLAKPFLAKSIQANLAQNSLPKIQTRLVREIYRRHGLKPARWESSAIIAVAASSSGQLLDGAAIERRLQQKLGGTASKWLLRFAPLAQWAPELLSAVSRTWAVGRYADSVCRIRKIGSDWLPAPLASSLKLPANLLLNWTEEAFTLALPVLQTLRKARLRRG